MIIQSKKNPLYVLTARRSRQAAKKSGSSFASNASVLIICLATFFLEEKSPNVSSGPKEMKSEDTGSSLVRVTKASSATVLY